MPTVKSFPKKIRNTRMPLVKPSHTPNILSIVIEIHMEIDDENGLR